MVTIEDFKKLELKVARIKEVQDHPNADKLYVLIIDLGGGIKQIVAGIKSYYQKEELLNKQIIVVDNLEPVVLRGVENYGMLLAAQDEKGICVIVPERETQLGSIVK